ncbi:recombinase family protein [Marinilactibacillus psychrotolerans]|uniref:Site-specific recombinase, resolvase family n=1 Tax=Marinilactibacillus psychrotolerans 42ea TaxID=1255609 RepID=A0A1R4IYG2_9LACT|nr:recombinase family protein [Marinilactibacillus psychrotolerans]SJN24749.1 site-specific recombinase, resolvase family [Marinilactibacillus psychrotolerans 42ea]
MKYGYARVSTRHQDLEGQLRQLEEERCDKIYFEKITGTKSDRPEFQKLLEAIQTGDTLVVTKLDRFARSTQDALNTIKYLFEKGVRINVLNLGVIENTSTGRLIFTIFSAFADFERDLIVERTQEGKEIAKQRPGFKEGRPKKYSKHQIDLAMQLLETHSYTEVEKMTGISKSTLTRNKRKKSDIQHYD